MKSRTFAKYVNKDPHRGVPFHDGRYDGLPSWEQAAFCVVLAIVLAATWSCLL